MYVPYPYQTEAADAGAACLLEGKRNGLMVIPSGAGKSLIIALIAQRLDGPLLVFQPSKEILEQNLAKFESYGYSPAVFSASVGRKEVGEITLATIGSVGASKKRENKSQLFRDFSYVMIDEAHFCSAKGGQYKNFFDDIDAVLLGLSATPYRLATNSYGSELRFLTRTKPRIFQDLIYYVQNQELFDAGYLAKLNYFNPKQIGVEGFHGERVKKNSTGADYDETALQSHLWKTAFPDQVVSVVGRLVAKGRHVLVFTRFVKESEYLASKIPGAQIVTDKTGKRERERIIADFRLGGISVVCNVGVLSTGFDYPELDTVVLARPTLSLALYYQQVMRAGRRHPEKESSWIIDLVGNVEMFGRVEDVELRNDGGNKWYYVNARDSRKLTNVYFGQDRAPGSRCRDCQKPIVWAVYPATGTAAPLCFPPPGVAANIILEGKPGEKKTYRIAKGDPAARFVNHWMNCTRGRQ